MCARIDQDHTPPVTKSSALQIHMEDFTYLTSQIGVNEDPNFYCSLLAMLFKYHHNYAISYLSFSHGNWNADFKPSGFSPDMKVFIKTRKLKWNDYTIWSGHEEFDTLPPTERRSVCDSDPRTVAEPRARSQRQRSNGRTFSHLVLRSHDTHSAQSCCEDDDCSGPDILNHKEGFFCDQHTKVHMPLCGGEDVEEVNRHCYHSDTHSVVHADMATRKAREYSYIDHWD